MIESGGGKKKSEKRHGTTFYIETLILAAVFAVMILTLARVFAWSGQLGRKAALLTDAVHLAENAAEMVAASRSLSELGMLLDQEGNTEILNDAGQGEFLRVWYDEDMNPVKEGNIWVEISWTPQAASVGGTGLVESRIAVYWIGEETPLYTLDTATYVPGP